MEHFLDKLKRFCGDPVEVHNAFECQKCFVYFVPFEDCDPSPVCDECAQLLMERIVPTLVELAEATQDLLACPECAGSRLNQNKSGYCQICCETDGTPNEYSQKQKKISNLFNLLEKLSGEV